MAFQNIVFDNFSETNVTESLIYTETTFSIGTKNSLDLKISKLYRNLRMPVHSYVFFFDFSTSTLVTFIFYLCAFIV